MSATKLYKQRCIDIAINSTTGSINFPMQDDLTNAFIVAMEIFTTNDVGISPATFQPVMSLADMKLCFVNLWREDKQTTFRLPLLNLHRMQNSATDPFTRDQFELDFVKISWTKCTIDIGSTLSSSTTVIPFSVYYLKYEDVKDLLANDLMFDKIKAELLNG
jgi:hypothetical protein